MKQIAINKKLYWVDSNEYSYDLIKGFENLKILNNLGLHERIISYISQLKFYLNEQKKLNLIFINVSHGGFIPLSLSEYFDSIYIINMRTTNSTNSTNLTNIQKNIQEHKKLNIKLIELEQNEQTKLIEMFDKNSHIIYIDKLDDFAIGIIDLIVEKKMNENNVIISNCQIEKIDGYEYKYKLKDTILNTFVTDAKRYEKVFEFFMEQNQIVNYDNLINLCVMVKNGGEQFKNFLKENLNYIDEWTILDTGSTDNTIDYIKEILVGKKKGNLYMEPFINFRDSRNRLLDLAGTQCKFNIMLDDTYIIKGDLRKFLTIGRGDQYSTSFSMTIQSDDVNYSSNRITKSSSGLRYKYKIHEVITNESNIIVQIPTEISYIYDVRTDYMETRTMERKQYDLKILYEELEDDPNEPRTLYYIAQTYNLLEDYENAYKYYLKRGENLNSGYVQERIDAIFEAARTANFKLNLPWEVCELLYMKAFQIDTTRPESLYYIGIHYYLEHNFTKAYEYFKQAFEIGYPVHTQYGLKPTLSFHFLPKFLTRICWEMKEYKMGEKASKFFLLNNNVNSDNYNEMVSWYNIYAKMNLFGGKKIKNLKFGIKPLMIFVADGGFTSWTGSTILTDGVGGSETYIIEMATQMKKLNDYEVIVFANTPEKKQEIFKNVLYIHLDYYYEFINTTYVNKVIISRYSEYLGVTINSWVENIYLVIHDVVFPGNIIIGHDKLKKIFCVSDWHKNQFISIFPSLKGITNYIYNGFNPDNFELVQPTQLNSKKIPNKFIYSSYPNRGLLELLILWEQIYEYNNKSTLYIYSDIYNKWSNDTEPEKMEKIKRILEKYLSEPNSKGINYCGWVNKKTLEESWKTAEYWLYPCTFEETFCITALEAAISKTLAICPNLAGLKETVNDRGVIIEGNPETLEWKKNALEKIIYYMNLDNLLEKEKLINKNYEWAKELTWSNQALKLFNQMSLDTLEYKEQFEWENQTNNFIKVIEYFKTNNLKYLNEEQINILELNTWTGITLGNIIKNISNSVGVGIEDYELNENLKISESFDSNMKTFKIENRANRINSKNNCEILFKFYETNCKYDFIYINYFNLNEILTSNENLKYKQEQIQIQIQTNTYTQLYIGWKLLNSNGIIGISNYKINIGEENINLFVKMIKNEKFRIIEKDYRIFIEKLE